MSTSNRTIAGWPSNHVMLQYRLQREIQLLEHFRRIGAPQCAIDNQERLIQGTTIKSGEYKAITNNDRPDASGSELQCV
jgi:hypothetical protein